MGSSNSEFIDQEFNETPHRCGTNMKETQFLFRKMETVCNLSDTGNLSVSNLWMIHDLYCGL